MNNELYSTKHKEICDKMHEVFIMKNHDYGNSASESYKEFGLISYIIRMNDKMNRIKTLSKVENLVKDESIKDTLLDLANYCVLALTDLEMDNEINNK